MKNIGIKLKEKREENGVSIEEAAEDLKLRPSQIKSIEEGKREDFKDVFYLKQFIKEYAKYLGLDGEELVDEFNEYLFDYTSKIPIDVIEKAKNEKKEEKKRCSSPYTLNNKSKFSIPKYIFLIIGIVALILIVYFCVSRVQKNEFSDSNITYVIRR